MFVFHITCNTRRNAFLLQVMCPSSATPSFATGYSVGTGLVLEGPKGRGAACTSSDTVLVPAVRTVPALYGYEYRQRQKPRTRTHSCIVLVQYTERIYSTRTDPTGRSVRVMCSACMNLPVRVAIATLAWAVRVQYLSRCLQYTCTCRSLPSVIRRVPPPLL